MSFSASSSSSSSSTASTSSSSSSSSSAPVPFTIRYMKVARPVGPSCISCAAFHQSGHKFKAGQPCQEYKDNAQKGYFCSTCDHHINSHPGAPRPFLDSFLTNLFGPFDTHSATQLQEWMIKHLVLPDDYIINTIVPSISAAHEKSIKPNISPSSPTQTTSSSSSSPASTSPTSHSPSQPSSLSPAASSSSSLDEMTSKLRDILDEKNDTEQENVDEKQTRPFKSTGVYNRHLKSYIG